MAVMFVRTLSFCLAIGLFVLLMLSIFGLFLLAMLSFFGLFVFVMLGPLGILFAVRARIGMLLGRLGMVLILCWILLMMPIGIVPLIVGSVGAISSAIG